MPEAYLFAVGEGATPLEALQAGLDRVGGKPGWLEELAWLGASAPVLDPRTPALSFPSGPGLDHFCLNASLRQLLAGERQMLALGQTSGERSLALLLGAPGVVGRRNLLPRARLHPAPALPAQAAALETAVQAFAQSLAEMPSLPEPSQEDKPLIISPAMPPPTPVPPLKVPEIALLCLPAADLPILAGVRRLERTGAIFGLANLASALETAGLDWAGLLSGLESASLLTLLERI